MRILVISDTHRHIGRVIDYLKANEGYIDRIIHLGDVVEDIDDLESIFKIPIDGVAGNCDWGGSGYPSEKTLEFFGSRILLVHGHRYQVKNSLELLIAKGIQGNYQCILFGHTHKEVKKVEQGCLIMNPGSPSLPKGKGPSFGLLEIENDGVIHGMIGYF